MPIKITHIIVGLDVGGAETMLYRLLQRQREDPELAHAVISLTQLGEIGHKLVESGVSVTALHLPKGIRAITSIGRIVDAVAATGADIVQTWMYHADFLGGIAARRAGVRHVVWNVRNTLVPGGGWSATGILTRVCAALSRWVPERIICCAEAARAKHADLGYDARKMIVIPNGIETDYFRFRADTREEARSSLGLADDQPLVGIVGRFDELKDFPTFIRAMRVVNARFPTARFVMIGRHLTWKNGVLADLINEQGLASNFILVDEIADVRYMLAAMDVFCLSSKSEGFPNVLIEAMAMERPCVSTAAGDAALILDSISPVVSTGDASALGAEVVKLLQQNVDQRMLIGAALRERVVTTYSVEASRERYRSCYMDLALGN